MTAVLAAAASGAVTAPATWLILHRHELYARLTAWLRERQADRVLRREVEAATEEWFASFKEADPAITVEWFAITDDDAPDEAPSPSRLAGWLRAIWTLLHDLRTGSQRDDTPGPLAEVPTRDVPQLEAAPAPEEQTMGKPSPDQPPTDDGPVPPPRHWTDHTSLQPVVYVPRHIAVDEPAELVSA